MTDRPSNQHRFYNLDLVLSEVRGLEIIFYIYPNLLSTFILSVVIGITVLLDCHLLRLSTAVQESLTVIATVPHLYRLFDGFNITSPRILDCPKILQFAVS